VGVAPWVAAGDKGLTVALDTTLTDELRAEGLAREIINKVQNLRKKSGLEVSDRIVLSVAGPEPVLAAVRDHADRITGETLADGVAAAGELPYKEAFVIDGHEITVALDRA
jgi:isoleucyl-tRNA synthetase